MVKKYKAYKYRLYPNKEQEVLINKTFGCVRHFWNYMVATFNSYDKETNPKPVFKTTTEFRETEEWLKEPSHDALNQKLRDFETFKKQLFNKKRKVKLGFPNFKKKDGKQSFRLSNARFKILNGKVQLTKIGKVRYVKDREIPEDGKIMSVTISKNPSGQYFISILVEQEIDHKSKTGKDVGIDVGIKTFAVQSDKIIVENPKYFGKNQAKLKRLQQHLSRKQIGSNRREKCRVKVAKLHQEIVNQREWFLHSYSTSLINNYDLIFIEDLDIKGLLEKKKLSKEISDVSWGKFFRMLEYKADWYGKQVVKVDRYYASSKTCSCGVKNLNLTLSDRTWKCENCSITNERDVLASENILKEGRRSLCEL